MKNIPRYPDAKYTAEGLQSGNIKVKCLFCERSHWSDECQRYKTLSERRKQIRGKCFICFSDKHFCRVCKGQKPCFYCKRRSNHHSALCPEKFQEGFEQRDNELTGFGEDIAINASENVIMKTANVIIRNRANNEECYANTLLDTGVKRTYVTLNKAKEVGLKFGPSKLMKVNVCDDNRPSNINIYETQLDMKLKDGSSKTVCVKICKTITGPMLRQQLKTNRSQEYMEGFRYGG